MTPIKTLIVDDNREFLNSVKRFLDQFPQIEVVGYVNSGYDALQHLRLVKPDLVLLDIVMPAMNGLEATRQIKSELKSTVVVILTLHNLPEYRIAATNVGADGFVSKSDIGEKLLPLIETLFRKNKGSQNAINPHLIKQHQS